MPLSRELISGHSCSEAPLVRRAGRTLFLDTLVPKGPEGQGEGRRERGKRFCAKERTSLAMVDVREKPITRRTARARGFITMGAEAFAHLSQGTLAKGDALTAAKLAGVMAAKKTHELIPLCHPLPLDHVRVDIVCIQGKCGARVDTEVYAEAKTGVEMEALAAVSGALLTLYDMCKPYGQDMVLEKIYLVSKTGGKNGIYESRRSDDIG